MRFLPLVGVAIVLGTACAASSQDDGLGTLAAGGATVSGGSGGAIATGDDSSIGGSLAIGGAGGGVDIVVGGSDAGSDVPTIYAHTGTTLFTLDPTTNILDKVGDFDCTAAGQKTMTDIAVDKDKNLVGVLSSAVVKLSVANGAVHCDAPLALGDGNVRYYGLTFAPVGVLDPAKEALIAANTAGELWQIDDDQTLVQRGTLGLVPATDGNGHPYDQAHQGTPWALSGDIVFLTGKDGSSVGFATVRDCTDPTDKQTCGDADTLLEIDVPKLATATTESVTKAVRGLVVQRQDASCITPDGGLFGNMYGIGAWGASVYGFSTLGDLVAIDVNDGSGCLVRQFTGTVFAGAGVTTLATVDVPTPK